jgi:hypothetical protein
MRGQKNKDGNKAAPVDRDGVSGDGGDRIRFTQEFHEGYVVPDRMNVVLIQGSAALMRMPAPRSPKMSRHPRTPLTTHQPVFGDLPPSDLTRLGTEMYRPSLLKAIVS